jgi:hypothetical protein
LQSKSAGATKKQPTYADGAGEVRFSRLACHHRVLFALPLATLAALLKANGAAARAMMKRRNKAK